MFQLARRNRRGMMTNNRESKTGMLRAAVGRSALSILCGGLFLLGCGGSSDSNSSAAPAGEVYSYQGVSNLTPATTGAAYVPFWSFVLEGNENSFSYSSSFDPTNNLAQVTSGTYSADGAYLALTSHQSGNGSGSQLANAGYALTIPGEAALLRPGSTAAVPVVTAQMSSCPAISSGETFLFVALPGAYWNAATSAAYGSIQASTDSTGSTWKFSNQSQSLLAASGSPPSYPASFNGTCGQGTLGYNIGVLATTTSPYYDPQIAVSPNGYFAESTTGSTVPTVVTPQEVQQPLVGVVAPSSALNTANVAAAKYLGLLYESLPSTSASPTTELVSFGSSIAGSGTTMTGGVFPKDDPTQTPAANITVNFGVQSSTQNGLYPGVIVTEPDTTETQIGVNHCTANGGTSGTAVNGSATCSFNAVAVVGNPKNVFAIFLLGLDPLQSSAPFGLYLYQQQ